jgi:hypothetical protein
MRAADELGKGHAHQLDIVDVLAFTRNETSVFLAHDACANAFNTHVFLPTGDLVSANSIERGGVIEQ